MGSDRNLSYSRGQRHSVSINPRPHGNIGTVRACGCTLAARSADRTRPVSTWKTRRPGRSLGLAGQLLDKHVKARKPLPDPEQKEFEDYEIKKSDLLNSSFMTM